MPLLRQLWLSYAVALGVLLCGCTPIVSVPTVTPSPLPPTAAPGPPPVFRGTLYVLAGHELISFSSDGVDDRVMQQSIASDVFFASPSPDGNYLLYGGFGDELALLDVEKKTAMVLTRRHPQCGSWSPDSKRFSVVLHNPTELIVYDTAGSQRQITMAPSEVYGGFGKVYGAIECGTWLDPQRLVFTQFRGPMPDTMDLQQSITSKPNTTALITMTTPIEFAFAPTAWDVIDICPSKSLHLIRDANQAIYIASADESPSYTNANSLNITDDPYFRPDLRQKIGFVPNSQTCDIYSVKNDVIIDAQTVRSRPAPRPPATITKYVSGAEWVQSPKETVIVPKLDTKNSLYTFVLIRTSDGASKDIGQVKANNAIEIVLWRPAPGT